MPRMRGLRGVLSAVACTPSDELVEAGAGAGSAPEFEAEDVDVADAKTSSMTTALCAPFANISSSVRKGARAETMCNGFLPDISAQAPTNRRTEKGTIQ